MKYQQLYAEALADPELQRTKQELEVAMENATVAREAVFELFQDLDGFSLEDYQPLAEREDDRRDILGFTAQAVGASGGEWSSDAPDRFRCNVPGESEIIFTPNREQANATESLELLGLDHPFVAAQLHRWQTLPAEELGLCVFNPTTVGRVLSPCGESNPATAKAGHRPASSPSPAVPLVSESPIGKRSRRI